MQKNTLASPSRKMHELTVEETKNVAGGIRWRFHHRPPIIWISTFPATRG